MPRADREKYAEPRWVPERNHWRLDCRHRGQRKSFYSTNPSRRGAAEVRKKADEWLKSGPREDMLFPDAWEMFLADYKLRNKETSYNQIASRGKAHLLSALKRRYVSDLTKSDWQGIIDKAYKNQAKSLKTLQGIGTTITVFCRWAATRGMIPDSDVPLYFSYPAKATTGQKSILQPDDLQLLFSPEAEDNWFIYMFRFLVLTGLRRGEICALQASRDYDGDYLTVRESISHEGILTEGKTKNAQRSILLTDLAREQIRNHRQLAGIGPYVFMGPGGENVHPRVLGNHWRKWRAAHGITLSLHELRHTYISYTRLKTEISLDELKSLYGHAKNMNTDGTYVHAIDKSPEEIRAEQLAARQQAEQIDRLFSGLISPKGGIKGGTGS